MSIIYEFSSPTENGLPYWHLSDSFLQLSEKELDPLIDEVLYKLCLWLDKNKATYEERQLAVEELLETIRFGSVELKINWNSPTSDGSVMPGTFPFRYKEGRNNEPQSGSS